MQLIVMEADYGNVFELSAVDDRGAESVSKCVRVFAHDAPAVAAEKLRGLAAWMDTLPVVITD